MILLFLFLFARGKGMVKAKETNMEKCNLPKQCFNDNDILVCRGFKTLLEINLKWKNCSEYKEPISQIYFYPSEKIILDSSLNWNSFKLKNLSNEYLNIRLENFKGFDIESKNLKHFLNIKIFNLAEFKSVDKDIYIYESLFDFYRNEVNIGNRCEITDFSGFTNLWITDSTIY